MLVRPTLPAQVVIKVYRWEEWDALLSFATACLNSGSSPEERLFLRGEDLG